MKLWYQWNQCLTLDNFYLMMHDLSQLLGSKDPSISKIFQWIWFQFQKIWTGFPKVGNILCTKWMERLDNTSKVMFIPPKYWDLDAGTHQLLGWIWQSVSRGITTTMNLFTNHWNIYAIHIEKVEMLVPIMGIWVPSFCPWV